MIMTTKSSWHGRIKTGPFRSVQQRAMQKLSQTSTAGSNIGTSAPLIHDHLTIDTLLRIWETVLKRSPVHLDDNFFDLGGDSLLALALVLGIEEETGRKLPVTTIYDAPTIGELAAVLHHDNRPQFFPLMKLRPGTNSPPVFMAPGAGASVTQLSRVAKSMSGCHPIYGIQARGLDGIDPPQDRVEDMAEYYVEYMRLLQPHGPYVLAGYSFGGLVVLEAARRLLEIGEKIALLALLDTYPHPRFSPLRCRIARTRRAFSRHAVAITQSPVHEAIQYILRRPRGFINHIRLFYFAARRGRQSTQWRSMSRASGSREWDEVACRQHLAWDHYCPRYYPGKVTFLRAETPSGLWPVDPVPIWGPLSQSLEVHTVPGDHLGLPSVDSESLGAQLSLCIERALGA
jgi:thioesterase domain-containing protein/acyl carrier protein